MALLLGPVANGSAQTVTGTLVEAGSGQPVSAALVQLLVAARDSIVASAVTGELGRFSLPRVAPGTYRLRALRIGFRPWISESLVLGAGDQTDRVFAIPAVPVVLAEISVESTSPCRDSPAEDRRMALLWDEARTALGLLGAGSSEPLEFRSTISRRLLDPGNHLSSENSWSVFGRGAWPITSQAPESLALYGFVQARDSMAGPIYFGPDVAVFFSDGFLRTHCFRLVPADKGTIGLVGLGFEPAKRRRVPDIEGVLWLDREGKGLRRLEYRYTRLWAWVPRGSSGGQLEFDRLPGGQPILIGWTIRAPVARVQPWPEGAFVRDETTRPFFGGGKVMLQGFREERGEVSDVRTTGGRVLWRQGTPPDSGGRPAVPSQGDHD